MILSVSPAQMSVGAREQPQNALRLGMGYIGLSKSIQNNVCKSFSESHHKECSADPRCPAGGIDDIDI